MSLGFKLQKHTQRQNGVSKFTTLMQTTQKKKNYTENNKYIWENSNDLNIQEMTDKFHNKDKFNYSEQYKDIEME